VSHKVIQFRPLPHATPHQPALTAYRTALQTIHDSGRATDERSYYSAVVVLFNAIGAALTPRVVALHDVADRASIGHPDFLLQVETTKDIRAAVKVKGAAHELDAIIASEQVRRYLSHHDPTLVTNLREFALVRLSRNKTPEVVMRHTFAGNEAAFWLASPPTLARDHAERFGDFLVTAMTWDAVVKRSVDLAEALAGLRNALSNALGLQFVGDEGEHFFRSLLVQTLFYGLFSAWVAYHRRGNSEPFRRCVNCSSALLFPASLRPSTSASRWNGDQVAHKALTARKSTRLDFVIDVQTARLGACLVRATVAK